MPDNAFTNALLNVCGSEFLQLGSSHASCVDVLAFLIATSDQSDQRTMIPKLSALTELVRDVFSEFGMTVNCQLGRQKLWSNSAVVVRLVV